VRACMFDTGRLLHIKIRGLAVAVPDSQEWRD
jgi:hypothetical protein